MKKQNGKNKNYVLDSSAFLALFEDKAKRRTKLMNRLAITRVESSQELGLIAGGFILPAWRVKRKKEFAQMVR